MKNIIYILIAGLFLFSACDKIEAPYFIVNPNVVIVDTFPPLDRTSVYRKILIEEYTGHYCTNCPVGHAKISELSLFFGDTLVSVCIHAGMLAKPRPSGLYVYDFTTIEGEQLYNDFNIDGIPVAVVNRRKFGGNNWALGVDQWKNAIENVVRTVYAGIQIQTKKIEKDILEIATKTTMLENYNSPLRLSIFLMEDNIIKPQLNNNVNDEEYQHNHVLRAVLNSTYGAPIPPNGFFAKDSAYVLGYHLNFKDKDWKMENCTVVVFLHDPETKEVLQVEVKKLSL